MVDISIETEVETAQRLRRVIAAADFDVHQGVWCFRESALSEPPQLTARTLAVVRDAESWSALVPFAEAEGAEVEKFGLFSFHFPAGQDNSGFVGWLAGHLKRALGTGVFVVCGSNRERGGIYDYWGCPVELLAAVEREIEALRSSAEG
ncbi:hypothetical protein DFR70_116125 [Nocardia tenerifensis]|uniref:Uncharacterized protein n=1 Tax=Nocardia tenerifensis TaxID=228006 RepID=A0A318JQB8_9NOCA|nr:DUF6196 family protein [Nocardia tenerifensis]PXX57895.1 hypothetical protein DFR70_116125 [Nocardia tenerifensis]